MDRHITDNRGFTLLEMLLGMMLLASLTVLVLGIFKEPDTEHLFFMNTYLERQCEALVNRRAVSLDDHPMSFYPGGRVDQARTVDFGDHKVIIHLGNGYLTYE
ncbi:MAG: prepilin-type N-terminal cleavage/methylation domain-containing protein [Erysipelotrichaceae bacterium]|nr:prepilin-type N-terminal cleavage/methylation domain-containing protein [Erysipelotrichaceae bacterium]